LTRKVSTGVHPKGSGRRPGHGWRSSGSAIWPKNRFCGAPGKTLIMVTHYPEEFPACIDHSLSL